MIENLRTLIVDSDPISRKTVIEFLSTDPSTTLIEVCISGLEAIAAIREFKPDVLVCEVETPGIDGFALLETVPFKDRPVTIFISNLNHFGDRAFEVSAADYIVRPLRKDRFFHALQRAHSLVRRSSSSDSRGYKTRPSRQLAIKSGRSVIFVKPEELDWAEAEGKYVRLHMANEVVALKMSISALEQELDPSQFVRIHRCTIVNIDRVRRIQPWNHRRTYEVTLEDGTRLVLSRRSKLSAVSGKTISGFHEAASLL